MIGHRLKHWAFLEQELLALDEEIWPQMETSGWPSALTVLKTVPGIQPHSAVQILAEIGPDRHPFPSAAHWSSWAGRSEDSPHRISFDKHPSFTERTQHSAEAFDLGPVAEALS